MKRTKTRRVEDQNERMKVKRSSRRRTDADSEEDDGDDSAEGLRRVRSKRPCSVGRGTETMVRAFANSPTTSEPREDKPPSLAQASPALKQLKINYKGNGF